MSDGLQAVIFDVDGVLIDSERHGHRVAFNRAFEQAGLPHRWDEDLYGELLTVGGGRQRLRSYLVDMGHRPDAAVDLAAQLHATKSRIFRDLALAGQVPVRPGAARLLDELDCAGVTVAVATTGRRTWVAPLLAHHFGPDRFAAQVTGDDVPAMKPDPAAYRLVLRQLGLDVGETIVIEDSANGFHAARAAGLECVVVVNDYTRDHTFDEAALVIDRFGDPGRAHVLAGPPDVLDDGALTWSSLRRVGAHGVHRRGRHTGV